MERSQRPEPSAEAPADGAAAIEETVAELIAEAEASPDLHGRIERLHQAAQIYETQLGEPQKAMAVWQAAFNEDYTVEESGFQLERVAAQIGAGPTLVSDCEALLPQVLEPRHRAALLTWLGRWLAQFVGDRAGAEDRLREALSIDPGSEPAARTLHRIGGSMNGRASGGDGGLVRGPIEPFPVVLSPEPTTVPQSQIPGDHSGLQDRLDEFVATDRWREAIDILKVMAAGEETVMRAKYLATAAKICLHKLRDAETAVDFLNRSLDADPSNLQVFERLYQMLAERRAWPEAESNLLKMIARVKGSDASPPPATLEALWRRLGEVYRHGLGDVPAAINAYQVCARLAPNDSRYPKLIAQIEKEASRS